MSALKVFILYAPGTNCQEEMLAVFKKIGTKPTLVFIEDILKGKIKANDPDLWAFIGGFSYGDHIATGVIVATLLKNFFKELHKPFIAICNGFQSAVRAGLFGPDLALVQNDSGVFCSRPIQHQVLASNCIWTRGLEGDILKFPAAHGYGKLVGTGHTNTVMLYQDISPNGGKIAGICTDNGLGIGMMDHPERPFGNPDGLLIFQNGVTAVQG